MLSLVRSLSFVVACFGFAWAAAQQELNAPRVASAAQFPSLRGAVAAEVAPPDSVWLYALSPAYGTMTWAKRNVTAPTGARAGCVLA